MNYRESYQNGFQRLKEAGIIEAELDARLLLEAVCYTNRSDLLVHGDRIITEEEANSLKKRMLDKHAIHIVNEAEKLGLGATEYELVRIDR